MSPGETEIAGKAGPPAAPAWIDTALAFAGVLPLVLGGAMAWLATGTTRTAAMSLTLVWGGAVLAFQSGVRRGLAVGEAPGAARRSTLAPLILALWVFGLAIGSMVALEPLISLALLIAGYVSLGVIARGERAGPRMPGRPRPSQLLLAVGGLGAVAARLLTHP